MKGAVDGHEEREEARRGILFEVFRGHINGEFRAGCSIDVDGVAGECGTDSLSGLTESFPGFRIRGW